MNVELITELIEYIEKNPEMFDMSDWLTNIDETDKDLGSPDCGTVGFIAGWGAYFTGTHPASGISSLNVNFHDLGKKAYDISQEIANHLFYRSDWPESFTVAMVDKYDHLIPEDCSEEYSEKFNNYLWHSDVDGYLMRATLTGERIDWLLEKGY